MTKIADQILELLKDDVVSHGWVMHCIEKEGQSQEQWEHVLRELLSLDIEIGSAKLASPPYFEFIAWKGSIEERLIRAQECLNSAIGTDREFSYWLALRKNVDRFEAHEA